MARQNEYIAKIDKIIASKIRSSRLERCLLIKELASSIDVTGQQLRKYESAKNRISAGRLALVAKALNKDIGFFYEGLDLNQKNE